MIENLYMTLTEMETKPTLLMPTQLKPVLWVVLLGSDVTGEEVGKLLVLFIRVFTVNVLL
jgi:hypothetical protein